MHPSPDLHALFVQLQSRYPTSALLTELVQVQDGQYIVKAIVQISGSAIASSMAAASTVEQAEDQARSRVLALLGVGSSINGVVPSPPPIPALDPLPPKRNGFATLPPSTPPTWLDQELAVADLSPLPTTPEPLPAPAPLPTSDEIPDYFVDPLEESPKLEVTSFSDFSEPAPVEEFSAPTPMKENRDRPASKPKKGTRAEAALEALRQAEAAAAQIPPITMSEPGPPAPTPEQPLPEPDDLSFLIAQTDIEMDRVGWTKQQGRDYLKATYNKSTRQRLDADELMDFLNYLRALPSLNGL
jgi:hypothetical protein